MYPISTTNIHNINHEITMMMFKKVKQKYFSFPTMKANVNLDRLMYVYNVKK